MLIIALGVLTLMAILGAAFASLIRLEKRATENYIDAKRMDLLLDSALDRVVAQLQGAKNFRHFSNSIYRDVPWFNLIRLKNGQVGDDIANGRADIDDPRVGKWQVFTDRAGQIYKYKTKVIDCAAQINLNGRQDTLARMLDNLGIAIEKSARLKIDGKKIVNPFYEKSNRRGNPVRGKDIVQLRHRLPDARFTSKNQLKLLIGPENFDLLKDFVTVSSWEDDTTYKATDGDDEVPLLTGSGTTSAGSGNAVGGGNKGLTQSVAYGIPRLDPEPRHPININTAPEEVLIACLMGLGGRRVFPFSRLGSGGSMQPINQGAQVTGERVTGVEEFRDITPRAVFVYSPRVEYEHAQKIAEKIIQHRKQKPFMAWRTNDPGQPGFEDFIDRLDNSHFPSPQTCQVIDPEQPQNRQIEALIIHGAATEVGRLWSKGTGQGAIRLTRQQLGLSFHDQYAWYYDLIQGVIKANFNPNSRINRYNPNSPAYIPVDKSDLVWAKDRFHLFKGHTTEFCFDSMGYYEVTGLGQIEEKVKGHEPVTVVGTEEPNEGGRLSFAKQMRTVVKIYEVLRHTTQFQFERTFQTNARSSKNDRKFVVTWPDPMAALTELVSSGSFRDGRVELSGLLDGRRLEEPIQQRTQGFRGKYPSIVMVHDFQDRDSRQISRLQRAASQGVQSRFGDEFTEAVRAVLNPSFSRLQPQQNGKYVSRKEMINLGGQANQHALVHDPEVNKEALGTDLFPDGLNSSILRQSHLQAKVLLVPARQRLGFSTGDGNPKFGASGRASRGTNLLGNVPYYKGGIAFWVKFEFDGDDPVFSGLIGCTQVIKEVLPTASDYKGSEGTQFFIFKNSKGQLRVVRMYYHQAFLAAAGGSGGASGGGAGGAPGIHLYPDPGATGADSGGASAEQNPIKGELDQKKIISRADTTPVDVSHFKAHEWHHIAVDWDDENRSFPRLYIDFQEIKEAHPRFAQSEVSTVPNSWVRLNERQPRDGLQIGGIIRDQEVADAGVFKWFTNTTGDKGAVQVVAQSTKRMLANATIDELICYDSTFHSVKQYYGASGSPGYFSSQPGEYANVFEIALPADVDNVVLRSFDWTSYYPTTYTDSRVNSIPQRLQVSPIQCELNFNAGNASPPTAFFEPWRQPSVQNQAAGRTVYRQQTGLKGNNANLVYKFRFVGSRAAFGNTAGGVVQTPVIDDVTLTYFLPSPKILSQEDLD